MNYKIVKLSVRMSENLKTRIELLAKKNNLTFTKIIINIHKEHQEHKHN